MTVDGLWTVTITSPQGPQQGSFDFSSEGSVLHGTSIVLGFSPLQISEGRVQDGTTLDFLVEIPDPGPMTVTFHLEVAGDVLTGSAETAGMSFPVTGERA